jgi:hypothetical protein
MSLVPIQKDIAQTLNTIYDTYVKDLEKPITDSVAILGGSQNVDPKGTSPSAIFKGGLIQKLFAQTPDTFPDIESTATNVYVSVGTNTHYNRVPITSADAQVFQKTKETVAPAQQVTDINVVNMISSKNEINALYALFDLMSDNTWSQYKSGTDAERQNLVLKIGELTRVGNTQQYVNKTRALKNCNLNLVLGNSWQLILKTFVENKRFIPFVVRRMAYLYIRMYSYYAANNYLLDKANNSTMSAEVSNQFTINCSSLVQAIYALIDRDLRLMLNEAMPRISKGVSNRIVRYNTYTNEINALSDEYGGTRDFLKNNVERMESGGKHEKNTKIMMIVAFITFLIVTIGASASMLLPIDFRQKMIINGGSLAFATLVSVIIFFIFSRKVVEAFNTSDQSNFSSSVYATLKFAEMTTNVVVTEAVATYKNAIIEIARDYLVKLLLLVQNITSYRSFGNATYSMAKEYRYYKDHNQQLFNTGHKYRSAHKASDLHRKKYAATISLFIILSIIVALLVMGYIFANEKMPHAQPYVLGIGGFFTFVVFVFYILEITSYVRTDGNKKYWSQPDHSIL